MDFNVLSTTHDHLGTNGQASFGGQRCDVGVQDNHSRAAVPFEHFFPSHSLLSRPLIADFVWFSVIRQVSSSIRSLRINVRGAHGYEAKSSEQSGSEGVSERNWTVW